MKASQVLLDLCILCRNVYYTVWGIVQKFTLLSTKNMGPTKGLSMLKTNLSKGNSIM